MSLSCAVFGHRFGEVEVERTREEEGSEVVSTEREVETCVRCGHRRVVSENKEVTTLASGTAEPAGEGPSGVPDPEPAGPGEDAEVIDEPVVREAEPAGEGLAQRSPAAGEERPDPREDDGVILEETQEREPGAWPEEPEDDEPGWQPPTEPITPEPAVESTGEAVTVPEGSFHCPECGFTTPVESSSLREGDFCPECHTGSLAHEPERR